MPIKIPDGLPGRKILERECVPLIAEARALRQDIRPLKVAILNLMPEKTRTETQLLRVLGATPLQVEPTLLHLPGRPGRHTPQEHLAAFYRTPADVAEEKFDALVMTGAPVERLPYEEVTYWEELKAFLDWADTHVHSSFFICWGAQAALYHYHGIAKKNLPAKAFGVHRHRVAKPFDPLVAGFDDFFHVPVSRHTFVDRADIAARAPDLEILAEAPGTGVCMVHAPAARRVFFFNHLEYDAEDLRREYERDLAAGMGPAVPHNYFPDDDPSRTPQITWRAHRSLLFSNWINSVYQTTPYDLALIDGGARPRTVGAAA